MQTKGAPVGRRRQRGDQIEGVRRGVRGQRVAAPCLASVFLYPSFCVPPPVASRAGNVIHLCVGWVREGNGGRSPGPAEAAGARGQAR